MLPPRIEIDEVGCHPLFIHEFHTKQLLSAQLGSPEQLYTVTFWNGSVNEEYMENIRDLDVSSHIIVEMFQSNVEVKGEIKPQEEQNMTLIWEQEDRNCYLLQISMVEFI